MMLLDALAATLGVLFGLIWGFWGTVGRPRGGALLSDPRVKNLRWVLLGAGGVFAGDWKLFGVDLTAAGHLLLALFYVAGVVGGILVWAALSTILVYRTAAALGRRRPALAGQAPELLHVWLQNGYPAYVARLAELEQSGTTLMGGARSLGAMGGLLSRMMALVSMRGAHAETAQLDPLIDEIMWAMENILRLFIGSPEADVTANYMVYVEDRAALDQARLRFADRAPDAYAGFLILRRYASGSRLPIALPVARPDDEPACLPGAPSCVQAHRPVVLNTRKIVYAQGVSRALRTEIDAFFKDAAYKSVPSLPLVWEKRVSGVLILESGLEDGAGPGTETTHIFAALAPFSLLLAELVDRSERSR